MFTLDRNDLYRLESNTPNEEKVVTALLRNYGGLFTDYNYIDEAFLASQCGIQPHQVYMILKSLSQRHILHFIPQKKTPYIRYTQRREDKEHILLMPAVYEERKHQFTLRIHAMLSYATNDSICRSRQLLHYFGEENSHDCHQCDVCLDHHKSAASEPRLNEAMTQILSLLDDGNPHPITDIRDIQLPTAELDAALEYLFKEEIIRQEDGMLLKV